MAVGSSLPFDRRSLDTEGDLVVSSGQRNDHSEEFNIVDCYPVQATNACYDFVNRDFSKQ